MTGKEEFQKGVDGFKRKVRSKLLAAKKEKDSRMSLLKMRGGKQSVEEKGESASDYDRGN